MMMNNGSPENAILVKKKLLPNKKAPTMVRAF